MQDHCRKFDRKVHKRPITERKNSRPEHGRPTK